MDTKSLIRVACVWGVIGVAGVVVHSACPEPQASAENPRQAETIRALAKDIDAGTYSLRQASK